MLGDLCRELSSTLGGVRVLQILAPSDLYFRICKASNMAARNVVKKDRENKFKKRECLVTFYLSMTFTEFRHSVRGP